MSDVQQTFFHPLTDKSLRGLLLIRPLKAFPDIAADNTDHFSSRQAARNKLKHFSSNYVFFLSLLFFISSMLFIFSIVSPLFTVSF